MLGHLTANILQLPDRFVKLLGLQTSGERFVNEGNTGWFIVPVSTKFFLSPLKYKLPEERTCISAFISLLFYMHFINLTACLVIISIQYSLPHSNEISSPCAHSMNDKDEIAEVIFLDWAA